MIERVSSRVVYQNPWMTVREDRIRRLDGSDGLYGVIDKPPFAIVAPYQDGGFWLVEQYRYPVGARFWEFPQGTLPDRRDGDPGDVARAELAEETGLAAARMTHLGRLYNAYGMSSQGCDAFLAEELTSVPLAREHEEQDMRHAWFPRSELEAMMLDGRVVDTATISTYALLGLRGLPGAAGASGAAGAADSEDQERS